MSIKWEEVIKKPEYQALNSGEKDEARRQFFEKNYAPKITPDEYNEAFSQFSSFAKEKERENMSFMEDVFDRTKELTYAGLSGAGNSVTGKYAKRFVNNVLGMETPFLDTYQPESMPEKIVSNVASIGADAGVFKLGGALATTGKIASKAAPIVDKWNKLDKITAGAGAFGLHSGLAEVQHKQERGDFKDVTSDNFGNKLVDNSIDPLIATAKGYGTGAFVSAAGIAAEKLGEVAGKTALKKGLSTEAATKLEKIVKNTTSLPLEGSALLGATAVTTGEKITPEKAVQLATELLILKSIHANPFSKEALKAESQRRGVNETQIIREIKDSPEMLKDPATAKIVIEEAGKNAEMKKPEQVDLRFKIQEQIATDMVMRNWKPGKTPEEILQLSQIPKEYRDYALTKTENGTYITDPRIIEKVNEHIKIKEIFDDSNLQFKDNSQELVDRFKQIREEYKQAQENLNHFERARDSVWEDNWKQAIDRHIGDYRRFANQPEVRNRMDEAKDQILSIIEPEQIPNIINDPNWLNSHYDPIQMGMTGLNKNHIKAIEKEVLATLMKQSNNIPQHIIDKATAEANYHTEAQFKKYNKEIESLAAEGKRITKDSGFKLKVYEARESNKTPEEKTAELKTILDKVRDESTSPEIQIKSDDTLSDIVIDDQTIEHVQNIALERMRDANTSNIQDVPGIGKIMKNAVTKFLINSRGYGIAKETKSGAEMVKTIQECYRETELAEGELHLRFESAIKDLTPKEKDLVQVLRQRGYEEFTKRAKDIKEVELEKILKANIEIGKIFDELLIKARETGLSEFSETAANYEIKQKDGFYILEDQYGRIIEKSVDKDTLKLLKTKLMIHKIGQIPDYLPRLVNPEILSNPRAYQALAQHLIDSGQIPLDSIPKNTRPEDRGREMRRLADRMLNVFNKTAAERRAFFQYERIIDLPETLTFKNKNGKMETVKAYEQDLDTVLSKYAENFSERITQAEYFGVKDQKLKAYLPEIAAELGEKYHMDQAKIEFNRALELVDNMTSADIRDFESNKVLSAILGYNVITKMGLSQIGQIPQIFMSIPRTNLTSAIKAMKWRWQSPEEARDFTIRAGSGLSSIRRMMMKNAMNAGSGAEKFLNWNKFSKMDTKSRMIAATTGLFYAEHLTDLLSNSRFKTRQEFAKRRLRQMEINPEEVIRRGRNEQGNYQLTEREKLIAARKAEVDVNFRARSIDLSPVFTSSPWWKIVTQFKSYAYEQTRNINNNIVKEAAHGNIQPLIYALMIGGASGTVVNELRGLITGRSSAVAGVVNDKEDAIRNLIIESMSTAGLMGIFNDVVSAVNFKQPPFGPTVNTAENFVEGVSNTIDKENPVYLVEAAAREIPIVGSAANRSLKALNKDENPIDIWANRYSGKPAKSKDELKDILKKVRKEAGIEEIKKIRNEINKQIREGR